MRYKNNSNKIKNFNLNGEWTTVECGEIIELKNPHIVEDGFDKVCEVCEKASEPVKPEPEGKKNKKILSRIKDFTDDLLDDGKRNRSNRKPSKKVKK